jgi:hypothetical protein
MKRSKETVINSSKDKIPENRRFLLKFSDFEQAFSEIEFDGEVYLNFVNWQDDAPRIDAHYWLPNERIVFERFYIRIGTCQVSKRKEFSRITKKEILPDLVEWMMEGISLPSNSPRKAKRYFKRGIEL